jgi:tetratricopeptide (TPR) repeat protein
MAKGDKTPLEYFENKEYDKALIAYQLIQKNDSLNPIIRQRTINSLGYNYLRENNFEKAVETFKINTVLYPNSSNVYDSLADAYLRTKDTLKAINYYKKALRINPENRSSQRMLKKITKK